MNDRLVLLTVPEVALMLRVPPRRVNEWRWSGRKPDWVRVGGRIRYRLSDIEAYLESGRRMPHQQQLAG